MKRRAILIDSGEAGSPEIKGPSIDVRRLKTWMSNNNGGAWNEPEFEVLDNPSIRQIDEAISRAGSADYAIVSFSGHGCIEEDSRTGRHTQKIVVGNNETIDFERLRPRARKLVMLCDACRIVQQSLTLNESLERSIKAAQAKSWATREMYRARFDAAIEDAAEGSFTMYGCSVGEYCYEDSINGGYFTDAMIENAAKWCDSRTTSGCLVAQDALTSAAKAVNLRTRHLNPSQNPNGGPSNRTHGNPFPFAVEIV